MKPVFMTAIEIAGALGVQAVPGGTRPSSPMPMEDDGAGFAEFMGQATLRPYVPPSLAIPTGASP